MELTYDFDYDGTPDTSYTLTVATGRDTIHGEDILLTDINADFFKTLPEDTAEKGVGWSSDIWDFDWESDGRSYKLPILKNLRLEAQKELAMPAHLVNQ
jgi:hypothetical protein